MNNNFLFDTLQNYIQYDVEIPVVLSSDITNIKNDSELVMWKNDMNEIVIGTREEFDKNKKISNCDYRIDDDCIIYTTQDKDKISLITSSVIEAFINGYSYSKMIDDLIINTKNDNYSLTR